jgi:hypothetical protein
MIIQNNENPLDSLYYLGYIFLYWIKSHTHRIFDIDELYKQFNSIIKKDINYSKFLLLLDWLHLNDCLDIDKNGNIKINVFN